MCGIFFKPWLGSDYSTGGVFGKKILVLGEAHYTWEKGRTLTSDLTVNCVTGIVNGDFTKQFWTNIAKAFIGKLPSQSDKERFWNSVAFYNYVQESVGYGPRVRPTPAMWLRSQQPFINLLDDLKPELVVVLGYQLWDMLPKLAGHPGPELGCQGRPHTWFYESENNTALLFAIKHPSSGFSGDYWHEHIKRAISHA